MFTGIIDHTGSITSIETLENAGIRLWINTQFTEFNLGESIAIDGICLTVTEYKKHQFACELSPETLNLTIASQYQVGQVVNIERPLRLQDLIGGHLVSGHVDSTITVKTITPHAEFLELWFSGITESYQGLVSVKGSIGINGVSLTINAVRDDQFSVMLIPHTLSKTNLDTLKPGDQVNIEYDQMAKLVKQQVERILEHKKLINTELGGAELVDTAR